MALTTSTVHAFVQPLPTLRSSFTGRTTSTRVQRRPRPRARNPRPYPYPYLSRHPVLSRCTSAPSDRPPQPTPSTGPEPHASSQSTNSSPTAVTKPKSRSPLLFLTLPLLTLPLIPLFPSLRSHIAALTTLSTSLPPARAAWTVGITNYFTVLFCFPANMAFMIAAGALLGPLPAFIALFTSKFLAAVTAFLLARRLLQKRVTRWISEKPRLARVLSNSVADWRFVTLLRLSPFPGFMLNYLLSVTGVRLWEYTLGTLLGTMPSVVNLVLVGSAARDVGRGIGGGGMNGGAFGAGLRILCTVAMVVVSFIVGRRVREVFREEGEVDNAEA